MNYEEFLKQKDYVLESSGFNVDKKVLNPMLFEFQKDIIKWALAKVERVFLQIVDWVKWLCSCPGDIKFTYVRGGEGINTCSINCCRTNKKRS